MGLHEVDITPNAYGVRVKSASNHEVSEGGHYTRYVCMSGRWCAHAAGRWGVHEDVARCFV
jgi:hypothetical protein